MQRVDYPRGYNSTQDPSKPERLLLAGAESSPRLQQPPPDLRASAGTLSRPAAGASNEDRGGVPGGVGIAPSTTRATVPGALRRD